MTVAGREEGAPPPVDLAAERRNGEFVASLDPGEPGQRRPRPLRRRPCGRARRDGDGRRDRRDDRGRGGRARILLRRGSGPLRSDRSRRPRRRAIVEEAKRLGVPLLAHRRHRRRRLEARRRGAGRPCGAAPSVRELASGLHGRAQGEEPHDSVRHRQDQQRLRLSAARACRRHQCDGRGGLHDPA